MFKKLALSGIGLALLATPVLAAAQTTDTRAEIARLTALLQNLLAEIAQIKAGAQASCVDLSHNLTLGSTGSDVTSLQNYLIQKGYLDPQYNTGYYGSFTAQAAGKLQLSLGIVSSANDPGYGIMGPRTRAAIACGSNPQPQPANGTTSGALSTTTIPQNAGGSPGKTLSLSLTYAGTNRTYLLHVPGGYTASQKYPLMISFHGDYGTGAGQERITGFDTVADSNGFIVAYPDSNPNYQQGGQWQLTGSTNDILFMPQLLASIESQYSIDASRVYISGFSEGGGMTEALACTATSKFAGFAVVSENLSDAFASRCDPSIPITGIFFHGTGDPVSPYNGGANGLNGAVTWSSTETTQFWVGKNGCSGSGVSSSISDTLTDGSSVTDTKEVWGSCNGGTSVTFYTIPQEGHAWPGGTMGQNNQLGPASVDLNASQIIWDTLSAYSR